MPFTAPNILTLLRIGMVPVFVVAFYLTIAWSNELATALFIVAGITDWLDGYLARRLNQTSKFGAFLDPVADKLMVTTALVLLVGDDGVRSQVISEELFTVVAAIIIAREFVVSALREWMAELGKRASVAVSIIGKVKTILQFVAISMLVYRDPLGPIPTIDLGESLLYAAAALTVWSMLAYLRAASTTLSGSSAFAPQAGEKPSRRVT
ncbi:MAG: CDP-diacylglycerol--glycerol-3-phosphate 3-phosphatidyltransferase [Gammaproteobacteria bacterium]|nr:CDP-diacylglycerol--glycerol-3-phosphate 3-phosphatidyltransferase [Gammaproteobacteria bacterium]